MKFTATLLALVSLTAHAQAWRADLEFGQDGWGLIFLICGGMAFIIVRDAYRKSKAKGRRVRHAGAGRCCRRLVPPSGENWHGLVCIGLHFVHRVHRDSPNPGPMTIFAISCRFCSIASSRIRFSAPDSFLSASMARA